MHAPAPHGIHVPPETWSQDETTPTEALQHLMAKCESVGQRSVDLVESTVTNDGFYVFTIRLEFSNITWPERKQLGDALIQMAAEILKS